MTKQKIRSQLDIVGVLMFLLISLALWSRLRYIRKAGSELLKRKEEADRLRLIAESERERAANSEKVKEQFLANMSHEIRTPMNAIMGMTDIIIRNDHPASQDTYLNAIRQSSENLLIILNEILDLSKLEAGKIELEHIQFSPEEVVRNVKDILRFKAEEKGLHLNVHIDEKVPEYLIGDPTRLNQIIVNLASNAIKFTEKGKVSIEVLSKEISNENALLQFKVIDTGIGIAKDKMNTIFEVFTQEDTDTTRKYGGTGLGLSICKKLVDLHKGIINLESIKGSGSTFIVEIPYAICDVCKDNKKEGFSFTLKDLNILLVEDNTFNVIVAQNELEESIPGVKIEVAENGKIAVEKVNANNYDIILMDVQMPEMDGYDATRAIRKLNNPKSKTPIIAMTANVMKAEIERCFEAGMHGYIPKPFQSKELLNCIQKTLELTNSSQ
ncbi:MAG: response regulator [Bacteroidales bacterium]